MRRARPSSRCRAAPAYAVRELPRDRALGGAGVGRHEGPAPPEPGEVGAQVLRRHAPERLYEGAEERMDGVDPVDVEWRHRMLATASGYQDRIVLRDTVWVDETYINDTDLSKGYGQARKRDQSRQKLCICAAARRGTARGSSSGSSPTPTRGSRW